jgi:hypothetical protein
MPLNLPPSSRFALSGTEDPLPDSLVSEAYGLLLKIVGVIGDRQARLEHFKQFFYLAIGRAHHWSSSPDYAEFDLLESMREARNHPALFLEALYDSIEALRFLGERHLPDLSLLNALLRRHDVSHELNPPNLVRLDIGQNSVPLPVVPTSLSENAAVLLRKSIVRAEELLSEQRPREAVGEILWMLESFFTTFRGASLPTGQIQGKYFNEIARELRASASGPSLGRVLEWLAQLHGYLSSTTGGGVRHGLDLNSGTQISASEGRLFVNLVLSYFSFLLTEHQRVTSGP